MSNNSSNKLNVPPGRVWSSSRCLHANEVGVNLKNGRGGAPPSREAGNLGKAQRSRRCVP